MLLTCRLCGHHACGACLMGEASPDGSGLDAHAATLAALASSASSRASSVSSSVSETPPPLVGHQCRLAGHDVQALQLPLPTPCDGCATLLQPGPATRCHTPAGGVATMG